MRRMSTSAAAGTSWCMWFRGSSTLTLGASQDRSQSRRWIGASAIDVPDGDVGAGVAPRTS